MTTNKPVSNQVSTQDNAALVQSTANGPGGAPAGFAARIWAGNRAIVWLSGLLIVQLALIAFVYWPVDPPQAIGGPLLDQLAAEDVVQLRIEDQHQQSVTLRRESEGWVVAGTDGYPADGAKANETIAKLLSIQTNRLVTRTEGSHARLQVAAADFNRRIVLTDSGGNETMLYLGVSSGGASVHVLAEGDNSVYLTQDIAAWETEPFLSGWVSLNYFSVTARDIRALTIHNDQGAISLARDAADEWQLDEWQLEGNQGDALLDTGEVSSLVSSLSAINLVDVLGQTPPPDFDSASALVRVELTVERKNGQDGEDAPPASEDDAQSTPTTETIHLYFDRLPAQAIPDPATDIGIEGTDAADEAYFVKSTTSDYYVLVSSFLVERLRAISVDGLLQTEPSTEEAFELPQEQAPLPFDFEAPTQDEGETVEEPISEELDPTQPETTEPESTETEQDEAEVDDHESDNSELDESDDN